MTQKIEVTIKSNAIGGMIWILLAVILGLLAQLSLFIELPYSIGYGILRPLFTTALLYGGILSLFSASVYYYLQKRNNDSFVFPAIAFISMKLQHVAVILGMLTIGLGYNKGREYGEFIYISDHLLILSLILALIAIIINIKKIGAMDIQSSYIVATFAGMLAVFFIGTAGLPFSPYASVSIYSGVQDQSVQEIFRLGLLSFFICMPVISLLVIYIPEYYGVSLYSESMARFHILATVIILPLAAAGWLAGSVALPALQSLGVFAYFAFFIAVIAGVLNLHFTITKSGKKFKSDSFSKLLRVSGMLLMLFAILRALFITGYLRNLTDYTFFNTRDISQDAASYALLALVAISFYYFQKMKDHTFGEGMMKILLYVGTSGMLLILLANLVQGMIQGYVSLQLDDKGELVQSVWSNILTTASFIGGDAKNASEFMQRYLGSLRMAVIIGHVMVLIAVSCSALVFIVNVIKNGNEGYKKPELLIS